MLNSDKAVNTIGLVICLLGLGSVVMSVNDKGFESANIGALTAFIVLGLGFATGMFTKGNKK